MLAPNGVVTAVYLVAMMFSIGLGMRSGRHPAEEQPPPGSTARARRSGPHVRMLLINLVLLPGVAVLTTRSLQLSTDVAFALLIVSACPGGRFAPHMARIAAGDVPLATSQVLLLSKLAVFFAPLTIKWLLGLHSLHIEGLRMIGHGLVLQMLPLSVGKAIAERNADLARRLERPLRKAVAMISVVALAVFLAHSGIASIEILGDKGWLAVSIVGAATLALGWLMGGRSPRTRRAIVISGMSRNLALALLLAGLAFPGGEVQLAVFGVWWIFLGASYLFARIASRWPARV